VSYKRRAPYNPVRVPHAMSASTEFFDAVKKGDVSAVREWLEKDSSLVNARTEKGFSPVTVAAYYGQEDVLRTMLEWGPAMTVHEASLAGDLNRVWELVEGDSRLANDTSSPDGFPPLGLAAHKGRIEVVKYLISRGADVNFAAPETGFTALTGAIAGGHADVVRVLLAAGANVNHRYEENRFSPLIEAAGDNEPEIIELLLDAGADVRARTNDGKSALTLAVEKGHGEVAEILRRHGATP